MCSSMPWTLNNIFLAGGKEWGGCGSGFQRQIMLSVAGNRGGAGSEQHLLLCVM